MAGIILSNGLGEKGMTYALNAFQEGRSPMEVVEAGIKPIEADASIPHVGIGGAPNLLGDLETDAAIMDGDSLRVGAIGALRGFMHPIDVARQVLEILPHVMLVGEGAARFAAERGAERIQKLPKKTEDDYRIWLEKYVRPEILALWPNVPLSDFAWPKNH